MAGGNNGIDLSFRRSNTIFGSSLEINGNILNLLNRNGDVISSVEIDLIKRDALPEANAENLGLIYLYTGETGEYTHGNIYECVENSGVYSWENVLAQNFYLKSEVYNKIESDDRFVHKTGDETISGVKTFTGISSQDPLEGHMIIQNLKDDFRYSDGTKNYFIDFRDKNNKHCAWMGYNHTLKSSFIELGARKTPSGNRVTVLEIGFDDDGNEYTYAPEPTEDTVDSHQLDTVGARNTKLEGYQDKETALNYNNISNCITEIPQDIKLELNNGVLTLKAGSKVYVPNGSGVFDTIAIENDIIWQETPSGTIKCFLFYVNNAITVGPVALCYSGTNPSGITGNYYNTSINKIDYYNNGTGIGQKRSLPLCVLTLSSGTITSIDQVFNGFGYIGSTVFALPGVKGLIPDGRNEDGSLKNIEFTNTTIRTVTISGIGNMPLVIATTGIGINFYAYDDVKNAIYKTDTGAYYNADRFIAGNVSFANGVITLLTPKTPFHAVDYNDTEFIGHQAMPSDRYIDLTPGASETTYTAPADGWFVIEVTLSAVSGYGLLSSNKIISIATRGSSSGTYCFLPVKKGSVCKLSYYNATVSYLRFVYAEGSK